jgi:predicted DNA-binding transcriptional regulator AlpA
MAAAYLDELDRVTFLRKVREKIYPVGVRTAGCRLRWRKSDLDATIAAVKPTISLDDDL